MRRIIFAMLVYAGAMAAPVAVAVGVVESRHNLSATGPGAVRASDDSGVCEFCHTPHTSSPVAAPARPFPG